MTEYCQIDEIRAMLAGVVARLCPGWLSASRDDLVQAAVSRVLDRMDPGEGTSSFNSSYLYRIAHSVLVDEIRRVRRRDEVGYAEAPETLASPAPSPDQELAGSAMVGALRECLDNLAEARKLAVTLHLEGHTVPEIAGLLGWRAKRADNALYRGLADLRRCLQTKGYNP